MTKDLQDARQAVVRQRVLAGVAEVLAAGHDLTFAKVAVAAGVPERTVYRHFPNRQELLAAVVGWVNERAGARRATTGSAAIDLVRRMFPAFDEVAPVVRELLIAPEGLSARLADNDARRRAALAVVDHEVDGLDPVTARRVAAVVQLLTSAAAWQTLRDYWDMDGAEAAEAVVVAIEGLLAGVRASVETSMSTPAAPARTASARTPSREGASR